MANALGLEHAAVAQEGLEDAGEAAGEGDDGDLFPAARGDAQDPCAQCLGVGRTAAEDGDGGLKSGASGCASDRPW
jgi:hypothetical protein